MKFFGRSKRVVSYPQYRCKKCGEVREYHLAVGPKLIFNDKRFKACVPCLDKWHRENIGEVELIGIKERIE